MNTVSPIEDLQMRDGESTADYIRRTDKYPPHWSADRCTAFDAKIQQHTEVASRGLTAADRAAGRRWLRRHGLLDDTTTEMLREQEAHREHMLASARDAIDLIGYMRAMGMGVVERDDDLAEIDDEPMPLVLLDDNLRTDIAAWKARRQEQASITV